MDAASGGQPVRGVVVGALKESHPDRIVVGDKTFFLRDDVKCGCSPGTFVEIVYTEQDGGAADSIKQLPRDR